ncbi:RsmB/NOP family class I SAM-dependent RNA methyltransferase [Herbiconiux sp. SYSU D00978]|uniref:RsmB/NOP family class I SAM-dependent RNA methyltransferase n=1 Tax=Herbiconiux sp. SYSU D00978 TaxID=2812562 RepID=UPI001A97CA91|nr:transcription antitermination factor NusB [Herbiconiux sp. SYSU D00978]
MTGPARRQPRPPRRPPQSRVQPARRLAYDVVHAVDESDAYANLLLPARLRRAKLSAQDAALATELTYGTLRRRGYYDRVIALASGRQIDRIDSPVLDVLRLAAHQLLSMRTAPHAVVDEAVSLARQVAPQASGFVNAVLRGITRAEPEEWRERALEGARSDDERLAIAEAHPVWVVRALRTALEAEDRGHELGDLLAADNGSPRVSLVALPGLADVAEVGPPARFSPVGAAARAGDPSDHPLVASGRARVQDEGSQLAALALSRARPIEAGERWLDLCAGPGGKAALLAAEAAGGGATLVANELVPARVDLVRNALAALPEPPEVRQGDGTLYGRDEPATYDRIMLDAPCTGLGALRRRPEARWRKQPSDVAELATLQQSLLRSALDAVKPGGLVAYVTCSPHLAETRAIVESVLRDRPDVERLDTASVLQSVARDELDLAGDPHRVQLWPHRHNTDAMSIQLLQRH